jgi:hypothetical protein
MFGTNLFLQNHPSPRLGPRLTLLVSGRTRRSLLEDRFPWISRSSSKRGVRSCNHDRVCGPKTEDATSSHERDAMAGIRHAKA